MGGESLIPAGNLTPIWAAHGPVTIPTALNLTHTSASDCCHYKFPISCPFLQLTSLQSKPLYNISQHDVFLTLRGCWTSSQLPTSRNTLSAVHDYLFKTFTSNPYLCPQISVLPHFSLHAMCIRPCMHSPQVPLHRCLQLSMALHGIWHWDSSSSENGSKTRQTTSELINSLLSSKQPCVLETQMMQDVRVSTQCYQEVKCPRMWCCVIG